MEINLRNVPFSEELVFFIRRCAGDTGGIGASDLRVRVVRVDATSLYEVHLARTRGDDSADFVLETDPDAFIAVRNAFEILKAREQRELRTRMPPTLDAAADAHS